MSSRSLQDLFHLVNQAVPEAQNLVTVTADTLVQDALDIMFENNFSQLPVLEGDQVLGVFSHRSFLKDFGNKGKNPASLPVEEFLEDLKFAHAKDVLPDLLDEFELKGSVLVGSEDNLVGVVTTTDALRFFYEIASPYVVLRAIELSIRELMRASVSESTLRECIERCLAQHYRKNDRKLPTAIEELSFSDYVMILRYKGTWVHFQDQFGGNAELTYTKLKDLPDLRNDVFHFKREIQVDEYHDLITCRNWLLKRIKKLEAKVSGKNYA
ncbi:MAG: CBS domain-containing protein [Halioglobus sp.]